ncbi:hypothetical protein KP509_17G005800 [Ceratopteris richardii]|uniref:B box-type domain-containing protein n=1 Tax=Ceratopteris richardii TaxID=49495 RepID=A0A8T2STB6_CERRI|nr:hypothetical protein KP509_17G005800 [Ceratopteris richardii]
MQEKGAFIFCLEDRALLCRDCDVGIHASNSLAAKHQRFLATGVRVALESKNHAADNGDAKKPEAPQPQPPATGMSVATVSTSNGSAHPSYSGESAQQCIGANELRVVEKSFKHPEDWQNTESLDLADLDPNYSLNELEFSKALLNEDWTMDLSIFNDHIYGDFAEVPDASLSMYPPISHGSEVVSKVKQRRDVPELVPDFDDDVSVVPDLSPTSFHVPHVKKRRFFTGI